MISINRFGALMLYPNLKQPSIKLSITEDAPNGQIVLGTRNINNTKSQSALSTLEQALLAAARKHQAKLDLGGTSVNDDDASAAEVIETVRKPLIEIIQGLKLSRNPKKKLLNAVQHDLNPFVGLPCGAKELSISIDFKTPDAK